MIGILLSGIFIGMAIMIWLVNLERYLHIRRLHKNGVLHTSKGTFVTTNSDGGYTFTPKPKGSKRV